MGKNCILFIFSVLEILAIAIVRMQVCVWPVTQAGMGDGKWHLQQLSAVGTGGSLRLL